MTEPQPKLFEKAKQYKTVLDRVFYAQPALMTSFPKFYHVLQRDKEGRDIPYDAANFYYENAEVKQVFKPLRKPEGYKHFIAFYPFDKVWMDTMYLKQKKSTLAFSCIVDLFTRYAYVKMFTLPQQSQAITSAQSLQTIKGFLAKIGRKYGISPKDVGIFIFDAGSEFKGDVTEFVLKQQINHRYAFPGDKKETSVAESFNRTLRLYLEKYRLVKGRITGDALKEILNSYNNVPHPAGNPTPIQIIRSKDKQLEVEEKFVELRHEQDLNPVPRLKYDQGVRVLLDRTVFQKIKPVWSTEIFFVENFDEKTRRYSVVDNDGKDKGLYRRDQLQPVRYVFKKP